MEIYVLCRYINCNGKIFPYARCKEAKLAIAASRSGNLLLLLYIVTAPLSRMCIAYSKRIQRILIAHICSNKLLLYHRLISRTQQELGSVCILTYLCTPSFCIGFFSCFFLGQRKHQDIVDSRMSRIYFVLVQNHIV